MKKHAISREALVVVTIILATIVALCAPASAKPAYFIEKMPVGATINIDGSSSEWTMSSNDVQLDSAGQTYGGEENWSGPSDWSARFMARYTDTHFIGCAMVTDNVLNPVAPEDWLIGDSFVVGIGGYLFASGPSDGNFYVTKVDDSNAPADCPGLEYKVKASANGWTAEWKVPFSTLAITPVSGMTINVDMAGRDSDDWSGAGVETYSGIGAGSPVLHNSTADWQAFKFVPSGGEPKSILFPAEIKNLADGTSITTYCWVPSIVNKIGGYFWVNDLDSFIGFRVNLPPTGDWSQLKAGVLIKEMTGVFHIRDGVRQLDASSITLVDGSFPMPSPLFMNLPSLGGAADGQLPFCGTGHGMNNLGKLFKVGGRVTGLFPGGFRLDGVSVYSTVASPSVDSFAIITGVSCTDKLNPLLPAIDAGDGTANIVQEATHE